MKKKDTEARVAELRQERHRLADELEVARAEATRDVIEGKEPSPKAAAVAERVAILDDAIAELSVRLRGQRDSEERSRRTRAVEAAIAKTAERRKLAARVDDALVALAKRWEEYREALRKDVGTVAAAGGTVGTLDRALANNRTAEPLVKAMIHAGGVGTARALGLDSPIRPQHASSLADAEARVAAGLQAELLRLKATSPQPNLARQAQRELEEMEKTDG